MRVEFADPGMGRVPGVRGRERGPGVAFRRRGGTLGVAVAVVLAAVAVALSAAGVARAEGVPYRAITDLTVITGSSSGIQCPSGYTKNTQDLNEGAGGDFVYLCSQYSYLPWADGAYALAAVEVESYTPGSQWLRSAYCPNKEANTSDGIPAKQELIDVDLNAGAGGAYLYFCVEYMELPQDGTVFGGSRPGYQFIYDIDFVSSDSSLNNDFFSDSTASPKADACREQMNPNAILISGTDLNQLAGGKYIYACQLLTSSVSFKDGSPPEITPVVRGTEGAGGWFTGDVTVSWDVKDPQSQVTDREGCADGALTSDTSGFTFTCAATSEGGTTSESVVLKRDATRPAIQASRTPEPNEAGWNNTGVTVAFTCEDATSGVAACSEEAPLAAEGAGQSVTGRAADKAGNTASVTVDDINIDTTSPGILFAGDRNHTIDERVRLTCDATDTLSGLAGDPCDSPLVDQPAYELKAGANNVDIRVADLAGNVTERTATYGVRATYDALRTLGQRFVSGSGEKSLEAALNNSLVQAEEFEGTGDDKLRAKMFATYLSKVSAYEKGGQLSRQHAEILRRWGTYMQEH